ncbi:MULTISPECIES: ATP-binding protein [unclassified Streptomyces]|uniref:ATP-binding protein n=1 Tax=unclassified Streptomyces TaxID=2593676 RepID=UPI001F40A89B|nr:ATP-binding protein [Streptomyces sp. AMCC400023]UJV42403.1 ATP-binding protein [Streptomyces sp. AMCC400023]
MEAHQIRFSVHGTPAAARSARQQLANGIRRWDASLDQDLLNTAELVAAELLTNAVRHAGHGPISAGARLDGERLLIEVTDASHTVPRAGLPDMEAEGGRGLFLVAALADRHGVDPLPSGKRCWAEFKVGGPLQPSRHVPLQRS